MHLEIRTLLATSSALENENITTFQPHVQPITTLPLIAPAEIWNETTRDAARRFHKRSGLLSIFLLKHCIPVVYMTFWWF